MIEVVADLLLMRRVDLKGDAPGAEVALVVAVRLARLLFPVGCPDESDDSAWPLGRATVIVRTLAEAPDVGLDVALGCGG